MTMRSTIRPGLMAMTMVTTPAVAQVDDGQPLYRYRDSEPRWFSFENIRGAKGAGGQENKGAKGHAFDTIPAGGSIVLADMQGTGTLRRMWITIDDRTPEMRRALRIDIYWDGARTPAVSAPLGDFFAMGIGKMVPMDNALFASAEGRSFVSYVPMPFRKSARVVVTNTGTKQLKNIFYDVDFTKETKQPDDALYFHAWWHRDPHTTLGQPFEILPHIAGRGRFLGTSVSLVTNPAYGKSWWGEGEVKMYLDGDRALPTLVSSGTEDYLGTGWGQGAFTNRYQGAPIADEATRQWTFYRWHVPDPIFFVRDIRVVLPQIGGAARGGFLKMQAEGAKMQPISIDPGGRAAFRKLFEMPDAKPIADPSTPDGWVNFYRSDDVAAVAYFYLDSPERILPAVRP